MTDRVIHATDLDGLRGLEEDGSKVFVKVDGDTVNFNAGGQITAKLPKVDLSGGDTPAETGNVAKLNSFFTASNGDTWFVDYQGVPILVEKADPGQCKGAHQERDVQLSAGAPLTLTHNFKLSDPKALGYSVIGVDGVTIGDWPTGVRFINHTANTVDVVADTGSGVVDVVLTSVECLSWVKKGSPVLTITPSLSYPSPKTYTRNVAITPIRPSVTLSGCSGTKAFSVSPALPAGLILSTTTGIIAGTPTTAASAANFVVTVTQGLCTASATVNLTVSAAASAPMGMSFVPTSRSFPVGSTVATFGPTLTSDGGAPVTYSIAPSLPTGLTFNTITGAISGTPTATSSVTTYTMTATNASGSTSATFTLDVYTALANWERVTLSPSGSTTSQTVTLGTSTVTATVSASSGNADLTVNSPLSFELATLASNAPSAALITLSSGLKNARVSYSGLDSVSRENMTIEINGSAFVPTASQVTLGTGTSMNATTGSVSATTGTGRTAVITLLDMATPITSLKVINKGTTAGYWGSVQVEFK